MAKGILAHTHIKEGPYSFFVFYSTRAVQKVRSPYFLSFFLGNTEINYQGENVQEVCTTIL